MRGLLEPFILDAISRQPRHGYALLRELEEAFGTPPNRNQVYPLLNRLEKQGYLRADRSGGRGKTEYSLTGKGLELLKDYRLRGPAFHERLRALWPAAEGHAQAAERRAPAPEPRPDPPPGPRLMERITPDAPLPPAPPFAVSGQSHAGRPCQAEVALRRRAGEGRIALEIAGLDPACPTCQELARLLRDARDRWFPA
jgi:DNA-binding PadR family transcriptional regulator